MSNGGSYDPHAVETEIYGFWEQGGYFHGRPNPDKKPYVIDIPLPNVTGALHLGHALNNTLQDILIRRARMRGYETMWMPGTDHAGIATQAVVEKKLKEEQNLTRHQLGREGLVKKIWEWKEEYGGRILQQLRRMGCSCDWERTRFTLDDVCARAVYEVFFQWFKAGLIYRGLRLVNWDAHLQTAVADDEIVHETVKGHLWHYRYPILPPGAEADVREPDAIVARAVAPGARAGVDYLVIATTRPETMLGDTAVAVHPDDVRYKDLIGRYCLLPLMNRAIPIIADAELVNPEFGTGCVKVTPAHDPNDYAFSQRHPEARPINILTPDGKINGNGGVYAGLDRYVAREKVVADLEALRLMEKVEDYETEIGHSDRSKTPIEPMLSEQWFVKMGDLAEMAMEAVRDGRVRFFPERYAKTYLDWLGEKRDWCISRQLWWGHRIPVWHATLELQGGNRRTAGARREELLRELRAVLNDLAEKIHCRPDDFCIRESERVWSQCYVCARTDVARDALSRIDEALHPACLSRIGQPDKAVRCIGLDSPLKEPFDRLRGLLNRFEQDPDVLDTWFSSALWPFSTLGWPHEEAAGSHGIAVRRDEGATAPVRADFEYFYPTTVLVTAREIITLWVARMVLTGLYFTGRVPFSHVYIHPNIQDGQGRRMSKSLGNGVDPLDIIELYGTDALRYTMAQMATETQDARMPVKRIKLPDGRQINTSERFEPARNFCNKLWQAATGFILPNLGGLDPRPLRSDDLAIEDRWILSRLGACIREVDRRFERYQISDVADTLRTFFWGEFCDWYLELVKPRLYSAPASQRHGELKVAGSVEAYPPVVPPERGDGGGAGSGNGGSAAVARQVLAWVLDQSLRLLHPLMPFITEALWQKLNTVAPRRGLSEVRAAEAALITATWPEAAGYVPDAAVEREMAALQDVIRALRDLLARINTSRAAARQPAIGKLPSALIRADAPTAAGLQAQETVLLRLGRCEKLQIGADVSKPAESATQVLAGGVEVYVPLTGLMDLGVERQRLQKEHDGLRAQIDRLAAKLANEDFVRRAPATVVEQERTRLAELRQRCEMLERNLQDLSA